MHFADSIFIFLLALVLFGPKRLPEIGRQIGKLLAEFRRASNEFKYQIEDELRQMEQQERQKKLEAETAAAAAQLPAPATIETAPAEETLTIKPPSEGMQVSASSPYASSPALPEATEAPLPETTTVHAATNGAGTEHHLEEQQEAQAPVHHG